jgi:hypothetical protein
MKKERIGQIMVMLVVFMATGILSSCEKADNRYSAYRAYFRYNPVSAKPNLFRACTSLGEFCSITYPPGVNYVIKSPSTSSSVDYIARTALQGYQGFVLGIGGGLVVGMPVLPEMLEQESRVVCYDLCCPNCYQDYHILKQMALYVGGLASCSSCQRSYDLNNQGIVSKGDAGRSLFRYYVDYYSPTQTLTVSNN